MSSRSFIRSYGAEITFALVVFSGAAAPAGARGEAAEPPPLQTTVIGDLELESGETLRGAKIGYRISGTLNAEKTNAIVFPTWFTGTSEGLHRAGALDVIDTSKFYLIVVDAFGNGVSSSPSNHPGFPMVTIGDMVRAQHRLVTEILGLDQLHAVMGISMGGMQTFEWITAFPDFMDRAAPIVGSPRVGAYDVLLWETELEAIQLARRGGDAARASALVGMIQALALQTPDYHARLTPRRKADAFVHSAKSSTTQRMEDVEAQLRAMVAHDVSRRFGGSMEKAAASVKARVLNVVGMTDMMVTPDPAIRFAELLGVRTLELDNDCGHLATSCDPERYAKAIRTFLE